eukprot:1898643-Rhodomonas_salina.1
MCIRDSCSAKNTRRQRRTWPRTCTAEQRRLYAAGHCLVELVSCSSSPSSACFHTTRDVSTAPRSASRTTTHTHTQPHRHTDTRTYKASSLCPPSHTKASHSPRSSCLTATRLTSDSASAPRAPPAPAGAAALPPCPAPAASLSAEPAGVSCERSQRPTPSCHACPRLPSGSPHGSAPDPSPRAMSGG